MNNFTYTVLDADIPVIYIGVSIHIHVKCVISLSVESAVLQDIDACIMVITHIAAKYVINLSVRAIF